MTIQVLLRPPYRQPMRGYPILCKYFILLCLLHTNLLAWGQKQTFDLNAKGSALEKILLKLEGISGYDFVYSVDDVTGIRQQSIKLKAVDIKTALDACLHNTGLEYEIDDNLVIIRKPTLKENQNIHEIEQRQEPKIGIKGKVTDSNGTPLTGVTVLVKGTTTGTITDADGNFTLKIPDRHTTLVFSSIGFVSQKIEVTKQTVINITLLEDVSTLEEVVVTGYKNLKKESYTGTSTTISGEEIMSTGGNNLIDRLSVIAPSIQLIENNTLGSDPNNLPEIRIRGESVFNTPGINGEDNISAASLQGDPNLPLFILDNFEVSLQRVLDLDQTRIESVTVLRGGPATALYGSRAANGIIVIKTKAPEEGALQVSYSLQTDFHIPDIESSYDLLEGRELFQLQQDLGILSYVQDRAKFEAIEKYLAAGVNTDWLAQPVHAAIGMRHSLNLSGGDQYIRYAVDMNYLDNPGVMKGSKRTNYGLGASLQYNATDKLSFENRIDVNFNNATNSPYGTYDYYAKMPSYLPVNELDGSLRDYYYYGAGSDIRIYAGGDYVHNPIYEAQAGNIDESGYVNIINNFQVIWNIRDDLRLASNMSFTYQDDESEIFKSPFSKEFITFQDLSEKGTYDYTSTVSKRYDGNINLSYIKSINHHHINVTGAVNIQESVAERYGYSVYGFSTNNPNPSFALGYEVDGLPDSQESTSRLFGVLGMLNYNYDNRYLLDVSYRLDGSSAFGANDRYAPFYNIGLGWNLHKAPFLSDLFSGHIDMLQLKANYGETGSINFSSYQAIATLNYYKDYRYEDELGTYLKALGNENLRWQTTQTKEIGFQLGLFNNRITGNATYYINTTHDMIINVSTPPSTGFESFKENLGRMENKGFEISLRGYVIRKNDWSASLSATGFQNKSKVLEIGQSLDYYNDYVSNYGGYTPDQLAQIEEIGGYTNAEGLHVPVELAEISHSFTVQYEENGSEADIWAVRSLGIDPRTGQEIFLTKDGDMTFEYNINDQVVVGNTEPDLRGTLGTNIAYKGLNLNLTFSYEYGAQVYNTTLVNKVENASKELNVDRRVLEETWQEPGDVVKYKTNLSDTGGQMYTYASSRFVQNYNYLQLNSMSLQYSTPSELAQRLKMQSLLITFSMGDLFYTSTVRRERGTSYPYARTYTLGLRANF